MKQYLFSLAILLIHLFIPLTDLIAEPTRLTISFQKQKDPEVLKNEADLLAARLSKELNLPVTARIPLDYSAPTQALISKTADVAYLDSVSFVLAKRDGQAKILLAEQRPDINGVVRSDYDSVFVVPIDSPIKDFKYFLKNSKNIKITFTSPTSTSGYLFPYKRLFEEGLLKEGQNVEEIFKSVTFGGSYVQALMEVSEGRSDICAVSNYAVEGPAAITYLSAEKLAKLKILERNPGVPTHVIAVRAGLTPEFEDKLKSAILKISQAEPELFKDVYGASSYSVVDEQKHVAATEKALALLKMN